MKIKVKVYLADLSGCGFYRLIQPFYFLKKTYPNEFEIDFSNWMDKDDLVKSHYDLVVIQRPYHTDFIRNIFYLTEIKKTKVVLDYDDNIFSIPDYNPNYNLFSNPLIKISTQYIITHSTAVITTNNLLKQKLSNYNSNVFVFPNFVNIDFFNEIINLKNKFNYDFLNENYFTIGYAGSNTHSGDLELIKPVLKNILMENKNIRVKFIGFNFWKENEEYFKDIPFEQKLYSNWCDVRYYPFNLLDLDLGLAPLKDNEFNQCKSPIKFIEYSSLSIPCVASNVVYDKLIINGVNGFILSNDRWTELNQLIKNKSKLKEVGEKAKRFVSDNFDIKNNIYLLREIIYKILN